jgi:DNA-binding MarR family transcriptional regulator
MSLEKLMIVRNAMRLGAFLEREGDRVLAPEGLTHQQYVVLLRVSDRGPLSHKEICSALLHEKSNISKIIRKLTSQGLVHTYTKPGDGRVQMTRVTGEGKARLRECTRLLSAWVDGWLNLMTDDEASRMLDSFTWMNTLAR